MPVIKSANFSAPYNKELVLACSVLVSDK